MNRYRTRSAEPRVTIYGLAHLCLNAFGPLTAAEVRALIADDTTGLSLTERTDLTVSRVTAALRSLVLDRAAMSVTENGIARYRLRPHKVTVFKVRADGSFVPPDAP